MPAFLFAAGICSGATSGCMCGTIKLQKNVYIDGKGIIMELEPGIKNKKELTVTKDMCADAWGSGGLPVYATPAMTALMENTAWESVEPCMDEGYSTVGTHLDVSHLSASPVGSHITCESELVEVDGRKLTFRVKAWDDAGPIGEGMHERFIINIGKFMARTEAKHQEKEGK